MNVQQKKQIPDHSVQVDLSDLIWIDPDTGRPEYDLRKATVEQLNALHIEEKIVRIGGTTKRTVRIRPRK